MKRIHILLGGFVGPDGWVDSSGMFSLASRLQKYGSVDTKTWDHWMDLVPLIPESSVRNIVIGYSGGGSRATWLANHNVPIDLMVLYDPSPSWQMIPIGSNVKKAISYQNSSPMFFGLGGGKLTGKPGVNISIVEIAEEHAAVQFDEKLHARTIALVEAL